jgi:hypothetical protein
MTKSRVAWIAVGSLLLGIVIGGNIFSRSQPRSFIALTRCENCLSAADLAGLLGSVGIQNFPGPILFAEIETDRTVAIRLPTTRGVHYVIVPKKDLKNVADLSEANGPYLIDAYLVARRLIERDGFVEVPLLHQRPRDPERHLPALPLGVAHSYTSALTAFAREAEDLRLGASILLGFRPKLGDRSPRTRP